MEFIIVCPKCKEYVAINADTYVDVELSVNYFSFTTNGTFTCPVCNQTAVLDVKLSPIEYTLEEE